MSASSTWLPRKGPGKRQKKVLHSACYCRILKTLTDAGSGSGGPRSCAISSASGSTRASITRDTMTLNQGRVGGPAVRESGLQQARSEGHGRDVFRGDPQCARERGESVKLSGFGNFQLRDKPQRPGRNPKTGEEIPITARRVVTFHASQKLKGMVEQRYGNGNVRAA